MIHSPGCEMIIGAEEVVGFGCGVVSDQCTAKVLARDKSETDSCRNQGRSQRHSVSVVLTQALLAYMPMVARVCHLISQEIVIPWLAHSS